MMKNKTQPKKIHKKLRNKSIHQFNSIKREEEEKQRSRTNLWGKWKSGNSLDLDLNHSMKRTVLRLQIRKFRQGIWEEARRCQRRAFVFRLSLSCFYVIGLQFCTARFSNEILHSPSRLLRRRIGVTRIVFVVWGPMFHNLGLKLNTDIWYPLEDVKLQSAGGFVTRGSDGRSKGTR